MSQTCQAPTINKNVLQNPNMPNCEILSALITVSPYLPTLFAEDICIGVTDREKHLLNQRGKELALNIKAGDSISQGGAIADALRTGKTVVKTVSKEVYGTAFESYAIPIFNQGQVVGIFVVGKSLTQKLKIREAIQEFSVALQHISAEANQIFCGIEAAASKNAELSEITEAANQRARGTTEIIDLIQSISFQSNLLGLNASIEAARAGQAGNGFRVVAQEIRNMSHSTSESVSKISEQLTYIQSSMETINQNIANANSIFCTQTTSLKEISAALDKLNSSSALLSKMAELI